jgi:dTDP-4-dehydrorhamnose 3,5-epimerase
VLLLEPKVFKDHRGFFMELYSETRYRGAGMTENFVQDNLSVSIKNVVRGLHYQLNNPQGKLVSVLSGKALDVVVDIRRGSPHFGQWLSFELNDENCRQVYVPPGFAHGYCALSEKVIFHYQCTDYYRPDDEYSILWSDEDLGIAWQQQGEALVSPKDGAAPLLKNIPLEQLPVYQP